MNPKLAWYLVSYLLGLASVGFVAGFFAGGSGSPVVGIVLPLIFGLLGGGSGLLVAKVSLYNRADTQKLAVLGLSLFCFSFSLWGGSLLGSSSRTGQTVKQLLAPDQFNDSSITNSESAGEAVALAVLHARLRALGVSDAAIESILKKGAKELSNKQKGIPKNEIKKLISEINQAISTIKEDSTEGLKGLKMLLQMEVARFQSVATSGKDGRPSQVLYLGELRKTLWNRINTAEYGETPDETLRYITEAHNRAMALEYWLSAPSWMGGSPITEEIDQLISTIKVGKLPSGERVPVFVNNPRSWAGNIS